jgi:hypothetical protein
MRRFNINKKVHLCLTNQPTASVSRPLLKTRDRQVANNRLAISSRCRKDPHRLLTSSAASNETESNQTNTRKYFTMHTIEKIRAVNSRIAELQATTSNLTLEEKKVLLESLSKDVQAAVAKEDGPKRRLANIKAAAADPVKSKVFEAAVVGLRRLGMEIEQIAASGSVADLDKAMRERKWKDFERFGLKAKLAAVGAIE